MTHMVDHNIRAMRRERYVVARKNAVTIVIATAFVASVMILSPKVFGNIALAHLDTQQMQPW